MDQFGMELEHGEIAMDLSDETLLDDKFSPRRTRSGRVLDSNMKRRRHRQQSPRSRNSSGQSAGGSVGDSSEIDQEPSDEYLHLPYFQSHPRLPSRRLDLSEETKDQELPMSSLLLDDILSPKKFKWRDQSSPLKVPTLPHHIMDTWAPRRFSFPSTNFVECDSSTAEKTKLTNINPFSPSARASVARKRNNSQKSSWSCNASMEALYGSELCDDDDEHNEEEMASSPLSSKRLKVSDINITRYEEEFVEIDKIASGEFGVVKKARHRLDGMVYAIKMTKKPLKANSRSEQTAMREVFAGAAMMKHKHIVRYYNSWVEGGLLFIQNEFCDGGTLGALIEHHRQDQTFFKETELRRLMLHIGKGLQYVHSLQLAHLDVKPGNILISTNYEEGEDHRTYKLADFGHVVPVEGEEVEPEEGDCRYMAPELLELNIDRSRLTHADIFSLGLSMYEAASLKVLPRNSLDDPNYENIKRGELEYLECYSEDLNSLICSTVRQESSERPTACQIVSRLECQSLSRELQQTREKLKYLENKLSLSACSSAN